MKCASKRCKRPVEVEGWIYCIHCEEMSAEVQDARDDAVWEREQEREQKDDE